MVKLTGKIEPKSLQQFQEAVDNFARELGKDFQDNAIHEAALLCRDAIILTPPILKSGGGGDKPAAKKWGEKAIERDVDSVYIGANKRSAAFMMYRKLGEACFRNDRSYFDNVIRNSNSILKRSTNQIMVKIANDANYDRAFQKAKNLFHKFNPSNTSDGLNTRFVDDFSSIHKSMKDRSNGRKIRKNRSILKGNWLNKYVASSQTQVDDFIKKKQLQVGFLKSGWTSAKRKLPKMKGKEIKHLGGKDPVWVARHSQNNGFVEHNLSDKTIKLVIGNRIGDNDNVATEANTKNLVFGLRVKTITEKLSKALAKKAAKFNKNKK